MAKFQQLCLEIATQAPCHLSSELLFGVFSIFLFSPVATWRRRFVIALTPIRLAIAMARAALFLVAANEPAGGAFAASIAPISAKREMKVLSAATIYSSWT